jgi:hypothetical protein
MPDDYARRVLADSIWACGDIYRWADRRTLRLELTRTEHRPARQGDAVASPAGDIAADEVWLVDLEGGRVRIEKPAARPATVTLAGDGLSCRVFVAGKPSGDLLLRAAAAGDVAIARTLALLPFSLLGPGLKIAYVGTRSGPGETRTWNRLLVTYDPGTGYEPGDRTLVEFNKDTHFVDAAFICWGEDPFLGGCWRVDMDEWWTAAGLTLAHRWRFVPVSETGVPTGPVRYTFQVRSMTFDVPVGWNAFLQP